MLNTYHFFFYHQRTPLYKAAGGGHIDIVKYFVEDKGDDINIKDEFQVHTLNLKIITVNDLNL